MLRIRRCVLLLVLGSTLPALAARGGEEAGAHIVLSDKVFADPKRGEGLTRRRLTLRLGPAVFEYRTLYADPAAGALVEQYGDHMFGLSFGRHGNGGWNLWKFLSAHVQRGEKRFDATAAQVLKHVLVLERTPRHVAEFVWPLAAPDASAEAAETAAPETLRLRVIHDPGLPEWLFLRLELTDPSASFFRVDLSAFPGNTSGPERRERWVRCGDTHRQLENRPTALPVEAGGLAFHNRYADERYGNFLVFLPEEIESLAAAGTYGVGARFTPGPETRTLHFALGYFFDRPWEEALLYFRQERRAQVSRWLKGIDWTPAADDGQTARLLAETKELLAQAAFWPALPDASAEAGAAAALEAKRGELRSLEEAHRRAREANDAARLLEIAEAVQSLRDWYVEEALSALR